MNKLLLLGSFFSMVGCASLNRDPGPDGQPPVDAGIPTVTIPDAPDKECGDACHPHPECSCDNDCADGYKCDDGKCVAPECSCSDDCGQGEGCSNGKCYERCYCDNDCSGPDNNSCDHGLCKGHE